MICNVATLIKFKECSLTFSFFSPLTMAQYTPFLQTSQKVTASGVYGVETAVPFCLKYIFCIQKDRTFWSQFICYTGNLLTKCYATPVAQKARLLGPCSSSTGILNSTERRA